ncbi:MAG: CoA pyrophosphatase, partial [bacterium]|nr:CoA pyrophosphatase [bacterium]
MFSLKVIREALELHEPVRLEAREQAKGRAAVAIVLAGPEEELRLCFILRARRRGDRWSGQMAFPGGRWEKVDASPVAIAERETLEEVGLVLDGAERVGTLSEMPISYRGSDTGSVLSPFVFYVGER